MSATTRLCVCRQRVPQRGAVTDGARRTMASWKALLAALTFGPQLMCGIVRWAAFVATSQ